MWLYIFRMQVFEKLVAESHIGNRVRQINPVAIVNFETEIFRNLDFGALLIGNIHSDHFLAQSAGRVPKPAIPRGNFQQGGIGSKKRP